MSANQFKNLNTENSHLIDISLPVFHPLAHRYAGNFRDHTEASHDFGPNFNEGASSAETPHRDPNSYYIDSNLPVFLPPRLLLAGNFNDHSQAAYDFGPNFGIGDEPGRASWESAKHLKALSEEEAHPWYIQLDSGVKIPFFACVGLAADHMLTASDLFFSTAEVLNAHFWVAKNAYDPKALLTSKITGTPRADAVRAYFRGLLNNFDHFNSDHSASERFKKELRQALDIAKLAYRTNEVHKAQQLYHQALAYCAFACHFLTDCFSAGHLRTPRRAIYDLCTIIYGTDFMPGVHTLLSTLWAETDITCTSAQLIAALYAFAAHNFDSSVGVRVQVRDDNKLVEYTTRGDGHMTPQSRNDSNTVNMLYQMKAVALARMAIFQTRFWGYCDYSYSRSDSEAHPLHYLPRVIDTSEAPIINTDRGLDGWLWKQTASYRKPSTFGIIMLAKELHRRADEYDKKPEDKMPDLVKIFPSS